MNESFESQKSLFQYPDVMSEKGEFERVASAFNLDVSVLLFSAQDAKLVSLNDDVWENLENTDSGDIEVDGWEKVRECSESQPQLRDWELLRDRLQSGQATDAPIVMKFGDRYHLVAGNTRLMAAKALGVRPQILLFEIDV